MKKNNYTLAELKIKMKREFLTLREGYKIIIEQKNLNDSYEVFLKVMNGRVKGKHPVKEAIKNYYDLTDWINK